jgi:hypothetical protein
LLSTSPFGKGGLRAREGIIKIRLLISMYYFLYPLQLFFTKRESKKLILLQSQRVA